MGFFELESFMYDCLLAVEVNGGMYFFMCVRRVVAAIYSA